MATLLGIIRGLLFARARLLTSRALDRAFPAFCTVHRRLPPQIYMYRSAPALLGARRSFMTERPYDPINSCADLSRLSRSGNNSATRTRAVAMGPIRSIYTPTSSVSLAIHGPVRAASGQAVSGSYARWQRKARSGTFGMFASKSSARRSEATRAPLNNCEILAPRPDNHRKLSSIVPGGAGFLTA